MIEGELILGLPKDPIKVAVIFDAEKYRLPKGEEISFSYWGPYGRHTVDLLGVYVGVLIICEGLKLSLTELEAYYLRANTGLNASELTAKRGSYCNLFSSRMTRALARNPLVVDGETHELPQTIDSFAARLERLGLTHPDLLPIVKSEIASKEDKRSITLLERMTGTSF